MSLIAVAGDIGGIGTAGTDVMGTRRTTTMAIMATAMGPPSAFTSAVVTAAGAEAMGGVASEDMADVVANKHKKEVRTGPLNSGRAR